MHELHESLGRNDLVAMDTRTLTGCELAYRATGIVLMGMGLVPGGGGTAESVIEPGMPGRE